MSRQSVMIESAQKPEGNLQIMAQELEKVFELATDKQSRPTGLTLGTVFIELSSCMGSLANGVRAIWLKEDYPPEQLVHILRLIMLYCLVAIEALTDDHKATRS